MFGIDTNVLLRYLTGDDHRQSPRAAAEMAKANAQNPAFISLITLIEAAWVLQSPSYGYSAAEVVTVFSELAGADNVRLQNAAAVQRALGDCIATGCHLPDALVARLGVAEGCEYTATFDKRATKALPAMRRI